MIIREDALNELYERLKENRLLLGVKTFKWTPTTPVDNDDLPCIFMIEETDTILEYSKRNKSGFPLRRKLEVALELVVLKDTDIRVLYSNVRRTIFTERGTTDVFNPVLAPNAFINENRTEGPTGYGLKDIIGMRLVLDLIYTDNGF